MTRCVPRKIVARWAAICITLVLIGCESETAPPEYVARVGERHLLREEVDLALRNIPIAQDSADARQQIVEQWITNELLHQEAQRLRLRDETEVQRLLEENERSVLVNALVTHFYEENPISPSSSEIRAYFENHEEQFRLRESFAHVRYLKASNRADAEGARTMLQQAPPVERDSIWSVAIDRYASDDALSDEISSTYFPESKIFIDNPPLRNTVSDLLGGQIAPIVEADSVFHVVQLVERIPAGTIPEPAWVEDEVVRRLMLHGRKQLYSRQVQRLRNEALAREDLEVH